MRGHGGRKLEHGRARAGLKSDAHVSAVRREGARLIILAANSAPADRAKLVRPVMDSLRLGVQRRPPRSAAVYSLANRACRVPVPARC